MYNVISELFFDEEYGNYISYGIRYTQKDNTFGEVSDLSLDKSLVEHFCNMLNKCEIEPEYLDDYIEDFLAKT